MIGGWLIVLTDGGGTLRVPWALARSDELAAGPDRQPPRSYRRALEPTTDGEPAAKLTLVLGAARSDGSARLEIAPVQRLSVDLYRDSQLIGRIVERRELLPGTLSLRHHGHRSEHPQAAGAGDLPPRDQRRLERRGDERAPARLHRRRLIGAGVDAVEVVLYEGAGCGLCARAAELLESEAPRLGFELRRVSIDGDEELERRHRVDLPVVVIDGEVAFTQAVAAGPLRRAVGRRTSSPRRGGFVTPHSRS